ncbi:MAG: S1C family serine protease [Marivibrio sp.]|uniref:S1C family serine protease n=1 Tax=Marivibrio sp. TaxID=2039719 RepID=UPI0032EBF7AE
MEIDRPVADASEAVEAQAEADQVAAAAMFGDADYKPIGFAGALSAIRHGTVVMNFPAMGVKGLSGTMCNYKHVGESTYEWRASSKWLGDWDGEVGRMVFDALRQRGFDVAGNPNAFFDVGDERARAQYQLGARLVDMKGNGCQEHTFWNAIPLDKYSAEVQIEVDWIVYDTLRREEIATFRTSGYGIQKTPKSTGLTDAFFDAWGAATDRLANNPDFAALLVKDEGDTLIAQPTDGEPIFISAQALHESPMREHMRKILASTVTIRVGGGHGTGYLISDDGYILTNQHVVGNSDVATVIFNNGVELPASVLRSHQARDVALLKASVSRVSSLPLRTEYPEISETVYAIGSPLDENLSSTVTQGVVSAVRRFESNGLVWVQADVTVNQGNSGGPLVDENGNVVAMTSWGRTNKGQLAGLNFFVPIASALEFMNIRLGDRITSR